MSISIVETLLNKVREQISQKDINDSLLKVLAELAREIKRIDGEVHRVRRDVRRPF